MSRVQSGADISAVNPNASVNLVDLAKHLPKTLAMIPPEDLIIQKGPKVILNLGALIPVLKQMPEFQKSFTPSENSGFLQNLVLPGKGCKAKMGGRLLTGSEKVTATAIENLRDAAVSIVNKAIINPELLLFQDAEASQDALAGGLGVRLYSSPQKASLIPIGFKDPDVKAIDDGKEVARVISAIESTYGKDHIEDFAGGVRNYMQQLELDPDDAEQILALVKSKSSQPGTQLHDFFKFIDDMVLSRVRTQVAFNIMDAISANSKYELLHEYVRRVKECFDSIAGVDGEFIMIDPSLDYGARNIMNLADHLRKADSYKALPVWPDWAAQLYETYERSSDDVEMKREISYRFRVNGKNPEAEKPALDARLDRLEENLLNETTREQDWVSRDIGALIFLSIVVPQPHKVNPRQPANRPNVKDVAKQLAEKIKANPKEIIRQLIIKLRERSHVMNSIAAELVAVLRTKASRVIGQANRISSRLYITVHRSILDKNAIITASSTNLDLLVREESLPTEVVWLRHISITPTPSEIDGIASFPIDTYLSERVLAISGAGVDVVVKRDLKGSTLPVRYLPLLDAGQTNIMKSLDKDLLKTFDFQRGIDIVYQTRDLAATKGKDEQKQKALDQIRTAICAAFALTVYIFVREIWKLCQTRKGSDSVAIHILRLQEDGRKVKSTHGAEALYAISHAVEQALSRDTFVKMQGYDIWGANRSKWRKDRSLQALIGGHPLMMSARGGFHEKMAVISYDTRPCDQHPKKPDADGFRYLARVYSAERVGDHLIIKTKSVRSRLVATSSDFKDPQPILEEILRLRREGYLHIILLSHHYGNRRIGRAAERHSPHSSFAFLAKASAMFPDVFLYPLRRDVFPATRLHLRNTQESAFEIRTFEDHQHMYEQSQTSIERLMQPIYTFATLAVVDDENKPQSGFCTYYFDFDGRVPSVQWRESVRNNILGSSAEARETRAAVQNVLCGIHYLESEKATTKEQVHPVLDPHSWASAQSLGSAGELEVITTRANGGVSLSFAALLVHVTEILYKDEETDCFTADTGTIALAATQRMPSSLAAENQPGV